MLLKEGVEMSFLELAKERYSVRKYSDRPIEKEVLDQVLEAGNLAPTARNFQPHRIYVLQSEEAIAKMEALSPCTFGAKTVLVFTVNTDEEWINPFEHSIRSGVQDVSIVATHIMMAAADLGLGTCWCNYFSNSKLEHEFEMPRNEKCVLFMPIGYPAEDSVPGPMHAPRKDISETVKYL